MARFVGTASALLRVLCWVPAVAGRPEAGGASHLVADDGADDLVALIQHDARTQRRGAAAALGPNTDPLATDFNCSKFPEFCQPPFDCHKVGGLPEVFKRGLADGGYALDGKPNYQLWCANPDYAPYAVKCVIGDVDGAAKAFAVDMREAGVFNQQELEVHASICFIEGYCVDTDVTNETTLEKALQLCDERFGHEAWTHVGSADFVANLEIQQNSNQDKLNGHKSIEQTRPLALFVCAMGHYHCDVRYCQQFVCKDEYYVGKYGHFLKEYGWVQ